MSMKYFTITAPRDDYTGEMLGGIVFVHGVARVSFDDTRDENGECHTDYPVVQIGRSAVLYVQRQIAAGRAYKLVETDDHGTPLDPEQDEQETKPKRRAAKTPAA
ncbi:hypothetical protein [Nonomuraea rhizosphaerae]|uniref:hypothetical protein n=1 Tax=Nonomuraea rhizosphaerae TaxID=2665663 RepID=UPI001C5E6EBF|nr:hypothetical protein [Nonomuraea rhizosphaerae]